MWNTLAVAYERHGQLAKAKLAYEKVKVLPPLFHNHSHQSNIWLLVFQPIG